LAFSPDGKILAGGSDCKILWLWDPIKKEEIAKFTTHSMSHSRYSSAFAFTPDGKTIQTWNSDYDGNLESITFWDVATQTRTDEVKLQPGIYRRMAFSPDCKIFAAVFGDIPIITMPDSTIYIPSVIKLYETATGKKLNTLKGRGNNVDYFIFSPDGKTLAAQSEGISFRNADNTSDIQTPGMLELWDVKTGNNLLTIKEGTEYIRALAFSPDGKILALGHFEDPIIELRDVSSGKIITLLKGHENENDGIMCMSFSPNGKMLASGRSDGTIEIWDIQGLGITGKSPSSTVNAPDAKTAKQIKKVK
jgi:WD40 repeat protein